MSHKAEGKTYLITGGASLIGSHIADQLLAAGAAEIRLLDNFSLGAPETIATSKTTRASNASAAISYASTN